MHLVVDAANVVGSRPDGWWRDRPGAARRLVDSIAEAIAAGRLEAPVSVVLEGAARAGAPAGATPTDPAPAETTTQPAETTTQPAEDCTGPAATLWVEHAERDGDSAIVALVEQLVTADPDVLVVTADRGLRARVTTLGARVVGPGWLRDRL